MAGWPAGQRPDPRVPRGQGIHLPSPASADAGAPGHATTSQGMARGGGILAGRITPRHTRWRPHLAQRSGWASPRSWQAVGQSSTAGGTTGSCPRCARQTANASRLLGAYSPYDRTTRVPGTGTGQRSRRMNASRGQVMRPRSGLADAAPLTRERHVTVPFAPAIKR
jgi:hypothetical protein